MAGKCAPRMNSDEARQYYYRSYEHVAEAMRERGYPMCWQRVQQIERRALAKLAADPVLKKFFENGV